MDQVNDAFLRWRHQHDDHAKYLVDLWTYCFVRRYFLLKFTRDPLFRNPADLDALIEQVYSNVQTHQHQVADTTRYANWVSVVCKNAFLNYMRAPDPTVSIDQQDGPQLRSESLEAVHDAGVVLEEFAAAVGRLPVYLRAVAYYRFVENRPYQEIGELTGKDLPIVRSYVNKAALKLRKDPLILALFGRSEL